VRHFPFPCEGRCDASWVGLGASTRDDDSNR
jgi:hypothetical protein